MEINFRAPLNLLGFGLFSFNYFCHMSTFAKVNWKIIGSPSVATIKKLCKEFDFPYQEVIDAINRPLNKSLPLFTIWHHHDLAYEDFTIRPLIFFETDNFTSREKKELSKYPKIAVTSYWAHGIISNRFDSKKVHVLPGIFLSKDLEKAISLESSKKEMFSNLKNHFNIENVFISGGKWEKRKQHFRLLDSGLEANTSKPTMILGIWSNPFTGGLTEPFRALREAGYTYTVKVEVDPLNKLVVHVFEKPDNYLKFGIIDFIQSMPYMHTLYRDCDGYISISAGEGWDQPLTEAMALGQRSIVSYNTAHIEYCNYSTNTIVECGKEIADDDTFFHGDKGNWFPTKKDELEKHWSIFTDNLNTVNNLTFTENLKHNLENKIKNRYNRLVNLQIYLERFLT